jgi:hypothetical protein
MSDVSASHRPAGRASMRHSGGMANRLASATSPYLLQHADNPVCEWGDEAFAEAPTRRADLPECRVTPPATGATR